MPPSPAVKRAVAFVDGQNLFHAAKEAYGYATPNYDCLALAGSVCAARGWQLTKVCFYTGLHSQTDNPFWNHFWIAKLAVMGTRGVECFTRPLRYREQTIPLPDGTYTTAMVGQEKGIDVRIALDVVRYALEDRFDVGLIFSQDQDLSEAVADVRRISIINNRWIKCACAYPVGNGANARGINATDWIRINRREYDACLDQNDYRPRKG